MKIVVLGAGIAGLSVAFALRMRGIEPLVLARGHCATAHGAGLVCSQFWQDDLHLHALNSQRIISSLVPTNVCGMVQVALNGENVQLLSGIPSGIMDIPPALYEKFVPEFRERIAACHFAENDFWIDNQLLLSALSRGIAVRSSRVDRIAESALICGGERVEFDQLIIASGAESPLLEGITLSFELSDDATFVKQGKLGFPCSQFTLRKSQLARTEINIPHGFHILDSGLYMRPAPEALIASPAHSNFHSLVGDGDEAYDAGDSINMEIHPTHSFICKAADELHAIFGTAALRGARLSPHSAGILRFSKADAPFVGALGKNIWLITGFGADGLALAPSMAESLVKRMLE